MSQRNGRGAPAPRLTVAIPFLGDDPRPLLAVLDRQARREGLSADLEAVLLDDGSNDAALTGDVVKALTAASYPARLLAFDANRGRAAARNALARAARAGAVLFLDADVTPVEDDFLARWLDQARAGPAAVFGGFVSQGDALDAALAAQACPPARRRDAWRHVYTSNLLARRELLLREPFDEGFTGWGWEDVEWAARAARSASVRHVDNPVLHHGRLHPDRLLERFKASATNFARFSSLHPDLARSMPIHRAARMLRAAPGRRAAHPALKAAVRGSAPVSVKVAALKLLRASWYGEVLR